MRVDALTELLDMLLSGNLDTTSSDLAQQITAAITPSLADNNVKAATTAAASLEALARALSESALRGQLDTLAPHLTDLLGNAKVSQDLQTAKVNNVFARRRNAILFLTHLYFSPSSLPPSPFPIIISLLVVMQQLQL